MSNFRSRAPFGAPRVAIVAWAFLFVVVVLGACASPPKPNAVDDFSHAVRVTAKETDRTFSAVELAAVQADLEAKATDFIVANEIDLALRDPVLTGDILAPRREVLAGLVQYAGLLTKLAGRDPVKELDPELAKVGSKLQRLNATFGDLTGKQTIPEKTLSLGTSAIRALGQFLVDADVRRTLPQAVSEMQPNIEAISDLLIADIGTPETRQGGTTVAGGGMRGLVSLSLNNLINAKKLSLAALADDKRIHRARLYRAYAQSIRDIDKIRQADSALVAAQASLRQMVAAHAKLVSPEDPSALETARIFLSYAVDVGKIADRAF